MRARRGAIRKGERHLISGVEDQETPREYRVIDKKIDRRGKFGGAEREELRLILLFEKAQTETERQLFGRDGSIFRVSTNPHHGRPRPINNSECNFARGGDRPFAKERKGVQSIEEGREQLRRPLQVDAQGRAINNDRQLNFR